MAYTLILGNKVYSSWSLRGWLLMRPFGIPFDQKVIELHSADFARFREETPPALTVPTLLSREGGETLTVWDSLSIAEFLHERHPDAGIWPKDPAARAAARSLCAEMHSGYRPLRSTMPMNMRRQYRTFTPDAEAKADIARIALLWRWAKERWGDGGPYLFGDAFTAAEAFYAPVASRLRTYGVKLDDVSQAYADAVLAHPATAEFFDDAMQEIWVSEKNEMDIE
ncbi:MAG: glutathione S-transferase [Alphaproteobacteria bacterium]